ncbi:MAG: peptidoglycan editing factor PgeF [Bacteroidia bacterium]|nr:peptidoglycan editing factor PgeF [Bacteroidia bacterium]
MRYFFSTENLSLLAADGEVNRKRIAEREGFEIGRLTCAEQVHGNGVFVVKEEHIGRGALDIESRIPQCDALVTDIKGVCLMILTADCVPVLLFDPKRVVVAAIHAGWKGTAQKIAKKTIETMRDTYGCEAKDMEAYIGPAICGSCFEVGEEVVDAIGMRYVSGRSKIGKPLLDLKFANTMQLIDIGLELEKIKVSGECTYHDGLHSWRREKSMNRIGSGIWL